METSCERLVSSRQLNDFTWGGYSRGHLGWIFESKWERATAPISCCTCVGGCLKAVASQMGRAGSCACSMGTPLAIEEWDARETLGAHGPHAQLRGLL